MSTQPPAVARCCRTANGSVFGPAFLFLAACSLAAGIAFTLMRVETHGKPLSLRAELEPAE